MSKIDVYCHKIAVAEYPGAPYSPSERYPELNTINLEYAKEKNQIYEAVREIIHQLGYDSDNYGTPAWNPFRDIVKKRQKVLIKPNMVFHEHPYGENEVLSMITNAALIRPIIDYILLATENEVEITIGDCPVQAAKFEEVARISGIKKLCEYYAQKGVYIKLIDMRMVITNITAQGIKGERIPNPCRKSEDYICVDLKEKSELTPIIHKAKLLEITDYRRGSVKKHHTADKNEYMIPREVLAADVLINIPKLKTHRKAGMTCAMKNMVGISGDKTCIAHHTRGMGKRGGDEFDIFSLKEWTKVRIWTFLKSSKVGIIIAGIIKNFFKKYVWGGKTLKEKNMTSKPNCFSEGSWFGNDTIWRCVKDLNKIIMYADRNGIMQSTIQRRHLCIVDGVLAGEGEGPMEQTTKSFGVIFGGENPVYVDYTALKLMKFKYEAIPVVRNGFENRWWDLVKKQNFDVNIKSNIELEEIAEKFIPAFGWQRVL